MRVPSRMWGDAGQHAPAWTWKAQMLQRSSQARPFANFPNRRNDVTLPAGSKLATGSPSSNLKTANRAPGTLQEGPGPNVGRCEEESAQAEYWQARESLAELCANGVGMGFKLGVEGGPEPARRELQVPGAGHSGHDHDGHEAGDVGHAAEANLSPVPEDPRPPLHAANSQSRSPGPRSPNGPLA
eukprot:1061205-Rhodomonas_salina.4